MGTVSTSLREQARSVFTDLGYSIARDGQEFRAERKWRVVRVTPTTGSDPIPAGGQLRCFVTWADRVDTLKRRLAEAEPEYDWAIIGLREAGRDAGYVVSRP